MSIDDQPNPTSAEGYDVDVAKTFNTITAVVNSRGEWLRLSTRSVIAAAVVRALDLPARDERERVAGRTQAADELGAEAARMRREDFRPGKVGIEYINGWEAAAAQLAEGGEPNAADPPVVGRPGLECLLPVDGYWCVLQIEHDGPCAPSKLTPGSRCIGRVRAYADGGTAQCRLLINHEGECL
jgi:hypothetical protein